MMSDFMLIIAGFKIVASILLVCGVRYKSNTLTEALICLTLQISIVAFHCCSHPELHP